MRACVRVAEEDGGDRGAPLLARATGYYGGAAGGRPNVIGIISATAVLSPVGLLEGHFHEIFSVELRQPSGFATFSGPNCTLNDRGSFC